MDSKFKISAEATGFRQLTEQAKRLAQAFQDVGRAGKSMDAGVAKGLAALRQALRGAAGGGGPAGAPSVGPSGPAGPGAPALPNAPPSAGGGGQAGGAGGGGGGGPSGPGGAAPGPQRKAERGPFTQGFLEGIFPGYRRIEREGAFRQAAGIAVGETARAAGSFVTNSVQGPEGVVGALASGGFVGRLLANNLGRGVMAARGEADTERGLGDLAPFMGRRGSFEQRLAGARGSFSNAGFLYGGLSGTEALRVAGGAMAGAGGTLDDVSPERARRMLAARAAYGVSAGDTAALMRGEDLGSAARGSSLAAVAGAKRLGLGDGAVAGYVAQIAAAVQDFAQTGIKVDAGGRTDVARVMELAGGVGGQRAAAMAAGFNRGAFDLAQHGAADSSQMATLMAAGYDPKKPASYVQAMLNLEDERQRGGILARGVARVRRANAGASPERLALSLRKYYASNQVFKNTHELLKEAQMPFDEKKVMADLAGQGMAPGGERVTDASLQDRGRQNTGVASQYAAVEGNRQASLGVKYMGETLKSEYLATSFQQNTAAVGSILLKGANALGDAANKVSNYIWKDSGGANAAALRP